MILARELFQQNHGQGDALPELFDEVRQTFVRDLPARLLFDLSSTPLTAVVEIEPETLPPGSGGRRGSSPTRKPPRGSSAW